MASCSILVFVADSQILLYILQMGLVEHWRDGKGEPWRLYRPTYSCACLKSIKLAPSIILLYSLGISRGEKGYAALPGRKSDFQASLNTAIEYAVAVNCPRQVIIHPFLTMSVLLLPALKCLGGAYVEDDPVMCSSPISHTYITSCRIHVLAGLLNNSISAGKAKETFISNISLAADECSKVVTFIETVYTLCTIYSAAWSHSYSMVLPFWLSHW